MCFYLLKSFIDGSSDCHGEAVSSQNDRQSFADTTLVIHEKKAFAIEIHVGYETDRCTTARTIPRNLAVGSPLLT